MQPQPGIYSLGVDEAGRGSWVGPLALCGLCVRTPEELKLLNSLPLKDSKQLAVSQRELFFETLREFAHECILYSAQVVDEKNINSLELEGVIKLVKNFSPKTLVWDAPVNPRGIPKLVCRLRYGIGWEAPSRTNGSRPPDLIVENKADENYLVCMAASIIAKVTRDREIEKLKAIYGDFGTGYPSDGKTCSFLKSRSSQELQAIWPHLRKKWSSQRRLKRFSPQEDLLSFSDQKLRNCKEIIDTFGKPSPGSRFETITSSSL